MNERSEFGQERLVVDESVTVVGQQGLDGIHERSGLRLEVSYVPRFGGEDGRELANRHIAPQRGGPNCSDGLSHGTGRREHLHVLTVPPEPRFRHGGAR